ncbi:Imm57 family immunity protein [Ralstonia sp. R-29]|uniref:Imm57 family immunity protein n=1 Tax=Ralstonia sp. R-29 TaxID=3404059 RepID=UPI003CF0038D
MKTKIVLALFSAMSCMPLAAAQEVTAAANEARQLRFAERVVTIGLARALSPSVRAAREKCLNACPETGALELAIGLIGIARGDASADTLVNLLGLRLDGAGSEELNCQILTRGHALSSRLASVQVNSLVEHCQSTFSDLQRRELADIPDVDVGQVCRSEVEVRRAQAELLKAINSHVMCEQ